ncbi:MAG: lipopolysaccharide assembly protein B [Lysobacteraceae bacterium]|nr:MAG: lipopolysaccharide assembly protein B [Xanthomonadaceae bacterium]
MTELSLLWLLLPVAAISGWYVARAGTQRESGIRVNRLSTDYFRGLNYLLNEQPDKAIEVFLKIAEVDSDTVETHLALGNLFRRRGEVDRAIRFHQNLISRPTLSPEQRTHALLELGEDYMRAGLLDRAEALFSELIEIGAQQPSALRHLMAIYQQESDWAKAIEAANLLEKATGACHAAEVANFQCEIAEELISDDRVEEGLRWVAKALKTDPDCVRASIIEGRQAEAIDNIDVAIDAYRRVADQDIDYLPDVLDPLLRCYRVSGRSSDARAFLSSMMERYKGISPVLAMANLISEEEGEVAAAEFMNTRLRRRPSVRGLEKLIQLNLSGAESGSQSNLVALADLAHKLLKGKPIYRCNNCGFGARTAHWQCPSCKQWNTVKPIRGVAGE